MNSFLLIVFPALWGSLSGFILFSKTASNPTLKLVHVLFRHGNRNPDKGSLIPGSKYYNESYYEEGYGQLTADGFRTEYALGNALYNRYTDFLTNYWHINYLDVRTTDSNRTKMSAELMLAGLYPPRGDQIWSLLFWRPIPYNTVPSSEDKLGQPWIACGTRRTALLESILAEPDMVTYLKRYEEMLSILDTHTGKNNTILDAFTLYFGFPTMRELGYELEDWVNAIYPEPIHSAAVDSYYITTNNTLARRLMSGYLLKKILQDTKDKINGTISPSDRKMFIYSGHELNVASMLLSLDVYTLRDIPAYGAYVLFEVHEVDSVWGIKLFYQNYEQDDPIPLKLPGCDYFCSYDNFYSLVEELIPTGDGDCN